MTKPEYVLTTERLGLREMTDGDRPFMARLLGHPEVTRFYPRPYTPAEAVAWIGRQRVRYERDGHGLWLAVELATGEPVGQVGLVRRLLDGEDVSEIGYMIDHPHWRRGLATEAALGVRRHAFEALGHARVISLIRPENVPSQRTALRVGMKPERLTTFADLPHLVFAVMAAEVDIARPADRSK